MRRPKILIQSNRNMEIESKLEQKTTSGLANGSEKSIKKVTELMFMLVNEDAESADEEEEEDFTTDMLAAM